MHDKRYWYKTNWNNSETDHDFCFSIDFKQNGRFITKTCLYKFDPLQPHFYIVKLGFTGVYIFFILLNNIDCGYSLVPPRRGGSNEYPQSMF